MDDVVGKSGQELLGESRVMSAREIYKKALSRLRIRTLDDGTPCWCLPTGKLPPHHEHDHRCKIARNLMY